MLPLPPSGGIFGARLRSGVKTSSVKSNEWQNMGPRFTSPWSVDRVTWEDHMTKAYLRSVVSCSTLVCAHS